MFKRLFLSLLFTVSVLYATVPTEESITRLYIGTFDRAPDAVGLKYWVNSSMTLEEIAASFFEQPETKEKYPEELTNADFIIEVYANLFGRYPDTDGFEYWLRELENGQISRSLFILTVINGALGDDAKILENKTEVGIEFAKDGNNDIGKAHEVLKGVTADSDSVNKSLCEFGLTGCNASSEPGFPGATPPLNHPPVADAGADQSHITIGTVVDLNGSGSSDPDGNPFTYAWTIISKPTGSSVVLSDATAMNPTFVTDLAGQYDATLVVNDGNLDSTPSNVKITVTNCAIPITHFGIDYCEIVSPYTGKIWLDRNLGAQQVCTFIDDINCYGNYYQWGRKTDGHQNPLNGITATQAGDVDNAGSKFITEYSDWTLADAIGNTRSYNWSKTGGNYVCPAGFRVPTLNEIKAELLDTGSAEISNNSDAFNSFLKLASPGFRVWQSGDLGDQGSLGFIWASTIDGDGAYSVYFDSSNVKWNDFYRDRANGKSVRCIKGPYMLIDDNFDSNAVGSLPSEWIIKYNGTGTVNQHVINTNSTSPSHSFQLEGRSSWAANIYKTPLFVPSQATVESSIYIDGSVPAYSGWFALYNKDVGAWGTQVGGLQFKDGKFYAYCATGNYYEITTFTLQQWYHVKIVYDISLKTYQIYIDGVLATGVYSGVSYTTFPMHPTVDPAQLMLTAGNGGTVKVFYDDVKMY